MKTSQLLIAISLLLALRGFAQDEPAINPYDGSSYFETHLAVVAGYNIHKNHFIEAGFAYKRNGVVGHHPSTLIYALTSEFRISEDFVWGLKAGAWMGGGVAGMNLGANIINYTDFTRSAFCLRPEIGFGFASFRVVYGYNFALTNRGELPINTHNFALILILNVKKLSHVDG